MSNEPDLHEVTKDHTLAATSELANRTTVKISVSVYQHQSSIPRTEMLPFKP